MCAGYVHLGMLFASFEAKQNDAFGLILNISIDADKKNSTYKVVGREKNLMVEWNEFLPNI